MSSNHDNGTVLNDSIDLCSNEDNSAENCDNVSHLSQFVNRISSAVKLYNRKDTSTNSDINEFEVLSEISSDELDNNKVINENFLCEIEGYENSFWAFRRTDSFKSLVELKCRYSVQSVKSRRISSTSTDCSHSRLSINEENISQKISNEAWQKSTRFEVWSWGCGDKGQLGHGDRLGRNHPCRIKDLSGHQIQRVFAGNAFSFALTASGVVFSWGDNGYGQLGHTDMSN
ncbi:alsin-like protein, partial [Leptotrombidium deliense]